MTTTGSPQTQGVPAWELHHRLGRSLEHAGVKVGDMAELLGVAHSTMSNYLGGRTKPRKGLLRIWALRCGVPLAWLETGAQAPENGPGGQESVPTIWKAKVLPLRLRSAA